MKKLQIILMVIILCFTITGIDSLNKSEYVEAATNRTVKLSSSSIKVAKGDSTQIKLNGASGTIIWKSSKASVAKVSSKGKVSAVKEGAATITAAYNKKSYKCKVTVTKKTLYSTAYSLTIFQPTTIVISTDLNDKNETISCSIDNVSIVDFDWGDWIDNNNTLLTLKPQKTGSTNIRIKSDKSDQELVIPVKVVSNTNYNDKGALTAKQIYAKCKSATVQITTDLAIGSGFYIAKGKLITNYHVIKDSTNISIMNTDGNTYIVKDILGYDETLDIAILSVSCTDNDFLVLNTHGLTTGEDVYAFGNPLGLTDTFTAGVVENTCRYVNSEPYIQSSAPISPGNSGGALVNAFGEVVGINSAQFTDGQNLNLAIPVHQIYRVSTYKPISLTDFEQKNLQNANKEGEVSEDNSKSNYYSTAQTASIGYYIYGTFELSEVNSNSGDYYKFVVTTPGYYDLVVWDMSERNGLYSELFTEKEAGIKIGVAPYNLYINSNNQESTFWVNAYIPEGTYYLVIFNNSQIYKDSDTNYKAAIIAAN